jgi:hypothetical protein
MSTMIQADNVKQDIIPLTTVQSECCGPVNVGASACGCEPGKPAATVINEVGNAVSACCGKPVNFESASTACCG